MVNFVVKAIQECLRKKDDAITNVLFGKQNGSCDCLHRSIDFMARVLSNDINLSEQQWMAYPITSTKGKRIEVPQEFYGGI